MFLFVKLVFVFCTFFVTSDMCYNFIILLFSILMFNLISYSNVINNLDTRLSQIVHTDNQPPYWDALTKSGSLFNVTALKNVAVNLPVQTIPDDILFVHKSCLDMAQLKLVPSSIDFGIKDLFIDKIEPTFFTCFYGGIKSNLWLVKNLSNSLVLNTHYREQFSESISLAHKNFYSLIHGGMMFNRTLNCTTPLCIDHPNSFTKYITSSNVTDFERKVYTSWLFQNYVPLNGTTYKILVPYIFDMRRCANIKSLAQYLRYIQQNGENPTPEYLSTRSILTILENYINLILNNNLEQMCMSINIDSACNTHEKYDEFVLNIADWQIQSFYYSLSSILDIINLPQNTYTALIQFYKSQSFKPAIKLVRSYIPYFGGVSTSCDIQKQLSIEIESITNSDIANKFFLATYMSGYRSEIGCGLFFLFSYPWFIRILISISVMISTNIYWALLFNLLIVFKSYVL